MSFQLLIFVLALVTIFGIIHSRPAVERLLFTETIYNWPLEVLSQGLSYISGGDETQSSVSNSVDEISESDHQRENENVESRSIEEIRAIRFSVPENADNAAIVTSKSDDEKDNKSQGSSLEEAVPSSGEKSPETGDSSIDDVLAAINASLQKLTATTNNDKTNNTTNKEIYDILVDQETKLKTIAGQSSSKPVNEVDQTEKPGESSVEGEVIDKATCKEAEDRIKLYFGDKPMEYLANQESNNLD